MNCRITQSRIWNHRIELELKSHERNAWATFTFSDENLPDPPDVSKSLVQKYIKTLRNHLGRKFRYFFTGEYGPRTWRCHYHAILFGVDGTDYHNWQKRLLLGGSIPDTAKDDNAIIRRAWGERGFVSVGPIHERSVRYCVGYICKKLTKQGDKYLPQWIEGRQKASPEFSLKSQGLGRDTIDAIACILKDNPHTPWPVRQLQHGQHKMPLGRYLTQRLHKFADKERELVADTLKYAVENMEKYAKDGILDMADCCAVKNQQAALNQRARHQITSPRRKL